MNQEQIVTYTPIEYIACKLTASERIDAIELLIDTMLLKMGETVGGVGADDAASGSNISEYWLDDGQVKIKTVYRSVEDVEAGIAALEKMKQRYVNRLTGRQTVLRDFKALR